MTTSTQQMTEGLGITWFHNCNEHSVREFKVETKVKLGAVRMQGKGFRAWVRHSNNAFTTGPTRTMVEKAEEDLGCLRATSGIDQMRRIAGGLRTPVAKPKPPEVNRIGNEDIIPAEMALEATEVDPAKKGRIKRKASVVDIKERKQEIAESIPRSKREKK